MIPLKKKQSELRKLNKKLGDLMARQDCDGEIEQTKKLAEACEKEINTLLLLDSIKYIGRYTCFEGGFTSTSKTTILFYQFAMTNRRFLRLQKAVRWQNLNFDLIISKIDENIPIDIRGDRHLGLTVSYIKVKRYISVPSSFNFYDLDENVVTDMSLTRSTNCAKKELTPKISMTTLHSSGHARFSHKFPNSIRDITKLSHQSKTNTVMLSGMQ